MKIIIWILWFIGSFSLRMLTGIPLLLVNFAGLTAAYELSCLWDECFA